MFACFISDFFSLLSPLCSRLRDTIETIPAPTARRGRAAAEQGQKRLYGEQVDLGSQGLHTITTACCFDARATLAALAVLSFVILALLLSLVLLLSLLLLCLQCSTLSRLTRFPFHDSQVSTDTLVENHTWYERPEVWAPDLTAVVAVS